MIKHFRQKNLPVSSCRKVMTYFFSERVEELYKTNFGEIGEYVNQLEPWEEIDAEIFDESMKWVIVITHEDISLIFGLEELEKIRN